MSGVCVKSTVPKNRSGDVQISEDGGWPLVNTDSAPQLNLDVVPSTQNEKLPPSLYYQGTEHSTSTARTSPVVCVNPSNPQIGTWKNDPSEGDSYDSNRNYSDGDVNLGMQHELASSDSASSLGGYDVYKYSGNPPAVQSYPNHLSGDGASEIQKKKFPIACYGGKHSTTRSFRS